MPKITISNQGHKVVNYKLNNAAPLTVLAILQENNIDWMHACGGKGKCTSCKCIIVSGEVNLGAKTQVEIDFIDSGKILDFQQMTCQALVFGNVGIKVPEKNKLPGVNYTN